MAKIDTLEALDSAMNQAETAVTTLLVDEGVDKTAMARWLVARCRRMHGISAAIDRMDHEMSASREASWVNASAVEKLAGEGP